MARQRVFFLNIRQTLITSILISGGAVQGGASFGYGARGYSQVAISVAGGQASGVSYTLDGGVHNDDYDGKNILTFSASDLQSRIYSFWEMHIRSVQTWPIHCRLTMGTLPTAVPFEGLYNVL